MTLGQPSGTFEQEKILTYRVGHHEKQGYYVVNLDQWSPWQLACYSLVLLFDDKGVLQKHKLVDVQ